MKKNIWENVYYRLKDPVEIKLAVLFTISYAEMPVSDVELKHCMLEGTSVDFLDLCDVIEALKADNHIKTVWRDEMDKFVLTPSGEDMIAMFEDKLLSSVKSSLKHAIDDFYKKEADRKSIRCDVISQDGKTFEANLELREGKRNLFTLSILAGSKERALSMCRRFRQNPYEIYERASQLLTEQNNEN